MQDYNYVFHGCMEMTIEMSCCKYPEAKELPGFWDDHKAVRKKYFWIFWIIFLLEKFSSNLQILYSQVNFLFPLRYFLSCFHVLIEKR